MLAESRWSNFANGTKYAATENKSYRDIKKFLEYISLVLRFS